MRRFRILLSLLLCLTVPVAGWASVLTGPACALTHSNAHEHADHAGKALTSAAGHHHDDADCADETESGTPCKGDHCGCGCGVGACTSGVILQVGAIVHLAVILPLPRLLATESTAFADAGGATLLRPPIA